MVYQTTENTNIRKEIIDGTLRQIIPKKFVFRQALSVVSTGAWKNTFWRENTATLTGVTTTGITRNSFKEIGRGAEFPNASASWEEVSTRILKFGAQDVLQWEDVLSDNVNIEARTIEKIAEGVASAEDTYIWNTLTENRSPTNIQSVAITATQHWTGASAAIFDNIMQGKEKLKDFNYDTSNVIVFISQRDERAITKWVTDKGAQFNSISQGTALNGQVPGLAGVRFVVSPNVTASYALMVIPQRCATLRELESLKTDVTDDPGNTRRIRAWEQILVELNEPKAIVLFSNTQGPGTE
jgi:hypothetical protein